MIRKSEIKYVCLHANCVPYPGNNYAYTAIENLYLALTKFEDKYKGKNFKLLLSNDEELCFEIKSRNLAHLLGIDYRNIVKDIRLKPLFESILGIKNSKEIDSYSLLKKIIENGDLLMENDKNNLNKFLNYYKIMIKTACFMSLTDFSKFDYGFINFDKSIYNFGSNRMLHASSDKLIFFFSHETLFPYYIMGLKKDRSDDILIPETIRFSGNIEKFLYKQELDIPVELTVNESNKITKQVASLKDKIHILNIYKALIFYYNTESYINIFNNYNLLNEESKEKIKII